MTGLCTFLIAFSRQSKLERIMEFSIVGIIAAVVLVYLTYALLYPERF